MSHASSTTVGRAQSGSVSRVIRLDTIPFAEGTRITGESVPSPAGWPVLTRSGAMYCSRLVIVVTCARLRPLNRIRNQTRSRRPLRGANRLVE